MSESLLLALDELAPHSRKWINQTVLARLWDFDQPHTLVRRELVANANWVMKPKGGAESLWIASNRCFRRKTKTLTTGAHGNLIQILNRELLGGQNYPILTTMLGGLAGMASVGAGLVFSAAAAGLDAARPVHQVLVRDGDEVWHVEEIGKEKNGSQQKPVYVSSFFIVDPYRRHSATKGWLIHEDRYELIL